MTSWVDRAAAALLGLALLALSPGASAKELRPYDAPRLDARPLDIPPLPLEYHTHEDAGIVLSYHPSTGERVRPLEGRVAAIRAELSVEIGRPVLSHVEIRVAAAPSEMARLGPADQIPSYATAVAFSDAHLVVMSAASPLSFDPPDLETWLRHELAHLALDEALGGRAVPRWFHEGYAVHFSGEDTAGRAEAISLALLRRQIIDLSALEARFPAEPPQGSVAAAEAADFARFLSERPSRERFAELLAKVRVGEPCPESVLPCFDAAVTAAYGEGLGRVELRWRREMARRYSFVPVFLATTLLWILVAAAVMVRRARRRRALSDLARFRGADASRRNAHVARRTQGAGIPGIIAGRRARGPRVLDDEIPEEDLTPPDPEVPKVEHDGRWYTLH